MLVTSDFLFQIFCKDSQNEFGVDFVVVNTVEVAVQQYEALGSDYAVEAGGAVHSYLLFVEELQLRHLRSFK